MSAQLTHALSFPLIDIAAVEIEAVADTPNAQVFVTVSNIGFYGSLTVKRVVNFEEQDVRGATNIAVDGAASQFVVDYECPLDVSVTYRAYLDSNTPVTSNIVTIVTDGRTFWLKDVILGAFSSKVSVESMSDVTRPANVLGTFKVLGRKNPITITDVRQGRTGSMVVTGSSMIENNAIINLISSGNTLLLQCPAAASFPDMYFTAGDVVESWNGGTASNLVHSWTIPFTETDAPSQSGISLDFNSWLLVTQFGTWANVLDKRATWLDVFRTPYGDNDAIGDENSANLPVMQIGARMDAGSYSGAGTHFADAIGRWNSITGIQLPVIRWYQAPGDFNIGTDLTQMIAAGVKVCLTLRPDYAPVNSAHLSSLNTMLSTCKALGADLEITLNHEPYYSGISNTQFVSHVQYYGPTVRQYYPLYVCYSGPDADITNGFYPGDAWVDGIAVDNYSASPFTDITNAQTTADAGGKTFAIWEFNGGADLGSGSPPVGQNQSTVTTHFQNIQNLFLARQAAGKKSGAILVFSSQGGTTGTKNFLTDALSQNGGFEGGLGTWNAVSGVTVAQTATQAKSFLGSMRMTATSTSPMIAQHTAVTPLGTLAANALPCVAGNDIMSTAWFKANGATRNCAVPVSFYDAAGAFISTNVGTGATNSSSVWTRVDNVSTAPANTAWAVVRAEVNATVVNGEIHYVDDVQISVLPPTNDLTSSIQYPWDYRIALLATMKSTLGV